MTERDSAPLGAVEIELFQIRRALGSLRLDKLLYVAGLQPVVFKLMDF